MKHSLLLLFLAATSLLPAQQQHPCATAKVAAKLHHDTQQKKTAAAMAIGLEGAYDVNFYHLDVNVERTSLDISGSVRCKALVVTASLDTFACLLHSNHTVDSVIINGNHHPTVIRQDSLVKVVMPATLSQGQTIDATVYYHGTCPSGGSAAIGNGFNNAFSPSWSSEVTWSLSESFVAYEWWPCKQDLRDKIDSSWVFITTDSTNKAGSNGLLTNVVTNGAKKRYEWKSHHLIDYYLISVSVAQYSEYNLYAHPAALPNDSILIQNYVYSSAINNSNWISSQKGELDQIVPTIELLSNLYGLYPFHSEKYGHCMAPLGGGMEHQTMTTLGFFEFGIDAHELGHQWFGDNVTCKSWGDIWINEGFASYSEQLAREFLQPSTAAANMLNAHNSVMSQAGGSINFTGSDTLNTARIFDSRLTYDKGNAVIHSIRFEINNDTTFFNVLKTFQTTYAGSVAGAAEFKAVLESVSGKNFSQFFNQWYYGEGYPTFHVKWNQVGNLLFIQSIETTSMPSSVPVFITPMEYKISRNGLPDTTVRLMQTQNSEFYTVPITGTANGLVLDPNNWIINQTVGPVKDNTITSIQALSNTDSEIHIGPNPTQHTVTVYLPSGLQAQVRIVDALGRVTRQQSISGTTNFDLSNEPNGLYSIQVSNAAGVRLKDFNVVKQ